MNDKPRKFRLLKDIPAAKAGTIFEGSGASMDGLHLKYQSEDVGGFSGGPGEMYEFFPFRTIKEFLEIVKEEEEV